LRPHNGWTEGRRCLHPLPLSGAIFIPSEVVETKSVEADPGCRLIASARIFSYFAETLR
jgi:hypothetical protein